MARFFGLAETVLHLGFQNSWDAEAAIARIQERQSEGKQITGKYYVQYSYDREKREALNAWGRRLEGIIWNRVETRISRIQG